MTTQHTPGPWHVFAHPDDDAHGNPSEVPMAEGWPFLVAGRDRGLGYNRMHVALSVQHEADARLIAAAPDLLAALRGLLECAEMNQDDMEGDTRMQIENALVAIARATEGA